jgi:hypothetical protein
MRTVYQEREVAEDATGTMHEMVDNGQRFVNV